MRKKFIYTYEETDSRVIYLNSVTNPGNVIGTSDTNVFVIALGCMGSKRADIKVPFLFS